MGFVDDAEISQVYRDARIGPIFEGTNYIQAQDLLGRKVLRDKGAVLGQLLVEIESAAQAIGVGAPPLSVSAAQAQGVGAPPLSVSAPTARAAGTAQPAAAVSAGTSDRAHPLAHLQSRLLDGCAALRQAVAELIERSAREPDLIGATAYNFLQWLGILAGGWQLVLSATRASAELNANEARAVVDLAAFYGAHVLPRASAHEAIVRHGATAVTRVPATDL